MQNDPQISDIKADIKKLTENVNTLAIGITAMMGKLDGFIILESERHKGDESVKAEIKSLGSQAVVTNTKVAFIISIATILGGVLGKFLVEGLKP